jgi:hypothetical protein
VDLSRPRAVAPPPLEVLRDLLRRELRRDGDGRLWPLEGGTAPIHWGAG